MGSNTAKKGNQLAQASLNESKRQYEEQQEKERKQKETAMANASGSRLSGNRAYANNFAQSTDFTTGTTGPGYSLLTAGGTESVIGSLLGAGGGMSNTLGG
jgi:hypothetical protein